MMTEEQIEKVAREYVRLKGGDPDQVVPYSQASPSRLVGVEEIRVPLWKIVAERVRDNATMREAMKVAGIGLCHECGWELPTHAPQCSQHRVA